MIMDTNSIYTIIISVVTVLGSASAWRYYEKRVAMKEKNDNFMKEDCRERITRLEELLGESSGEKDELRREVLKLTKLVGELSTKVEFLEKENNMLLKKFKMT